MKNKIFNVIKVILIIFVIALASYVISFIVNNYQILKNYDSRGITYLNYEVNDNVISYSFDEPAYVNKVLFNYNIDKNVDWTLECVYIDIYGNEQDYTITGTANSTIDIFSEKIDLKLVSIKIIFEKTNSYLDVDELSVIDQYNIRNFQMKNQIVFFSTSTYFLFVLGIVLYLLIYFRNYMKNHLEIVFAIIAFGVGIVSILSYPIATNISWDDHIHYYNAYSLFHDYYTEATAFLKEPETNYYGYFNTTEEQNALVKYLNGANKVELETESYNSFDFSDVAYILPAFVLKINDTIGVPLSISFSLTKLFNLLIYIFLVYKAIKKIPIGKYLMLCVALIPTTIFMATNFSYDPPVTGLILLAISYFIYEYVNKEKKISRKNLLIIIGSLIIASCIKIVYCPFLLMLFLLPKEKFKSKSSRVLYYILLTIILFLLAMTYILPSASSEIVADSRGGDTSIIRQITVIINSPLSFLSMFSQEVFPEFFEYIFSQKTFMWYYHIGLSESLNTYYIYLVALVFSVFMDKNDKYKFDKKFNILWLIMIMGIYCLVWFAMYISFTPVGYTSINGVTYRYFIPLVFPLVFLLYNIPIKINISENTKYLVYILMLILISFTSILDNLVYLVV